MYEFYDFIEYFSYCYGLEIIGMILAAVFGCLGYAAKQIYKGYIDKQNDRIDSDTKVAIARAVVQFVEQAWKTLHGADKLRKALEAAEVLLKKKHIPFDADEMMILIEAAVAEFNNAFKAPLIDGSTAAATYRPYEGPQQSGETEAYTE